MQRWLVIAAAFCAAFGAAAQEAVPQRQMTVTQGPDSVFDRPPADILPALAGATATGENGRVGTELVFWGFEQSDGRRVFFFACAPVPGLDCAARVPAICPAATTVLATTEANGKTVHRSCRTFAVAQPGEIRPGCDDRVQPQTPLAVGLVSCS